MANVRRLVSETDSGPSAAMYSAVSGAAHDKVVEVDEAVLGEVVGQFTRVLHADLHDTVTRGKCL